MGRTPCFWANATASVESAAVPEGHATAPDAAYVAAALCQVLGGRNGGGRDGGDGAGPAASGGDGGLWDSVGGLRLWGQA